MLMRWLLIRNRFVSQPNMKACIRFLNGHYREGPARIQTDGALYSANYGDVETRHTIMETYAGAGGGRNGMVAVWNSMER